MSDQQKNVVLRYILDVDQGKAKQAADAMRSQQAAIKETTAVFARHQDGVKSLLRTYSDFEIAARKLGTVGRDMAIAGAAILGPLTIAANEYVKRYGALEQTSRNFIAAQQAQTNAVSNLGRVAAAALTPLMNQSAMFLQKVADFAAAHPDLVNTAVSVGGGLAAGGAALVSASLAISSVAKAGDLLKAAFGGGGGLSGIGSLAGAVSSATIGIAALGAGALAGVAIVNKVGEATGNEVLAHYKLSDALQTARQIIGSAVLALAGAFIEAKKSWGEIQDIITGVFENFKITIRTIADQLGTGFEVVFKNLQNGLGQFVNGILLVVANLATSLNQPELAKNLIAARDPNAIGIGPNGQTGYQSQAQQLVTDYNTRQAGRDTEKNGVGVQLAANGTARDAQYAADKANLANFGKDIAKFASTGSLGPALDGVIGKIGTAISGFIGKFTGGKAPGATTNGVGLPPEAVQDYIDYRKAVANSDKQYAQEAAKITVDFNASERKAKQDHADEMLKLQQEEQQAETDLAQKYQQEQAKAAGDFAFSEKQTDEKNNFDRLERLRQYTFQAQDLAANRDVAGFVTNLRQFNFQEAEKKRSEDFDAQARKESFDHEQADKKAQYAIDLANLKRQDQIKRDQAEKAFQNEERDRAAQYKQQLDDLRQHHIDENSALEADFAAKLASLNGNIAGLQNIQSAYYGQATKDALDFVTTQKATLDQLYKNYLGVTTGASGGATAPGANEMGGHTLGSNAAHSHRLGLDYVPYDGYRAILHKGESVRTATQTSQGGGMTVVIQSLNMGAIATPADVERGKAEVVKAVVQGLAEGDRRARS